MRVEKHYCRSRACENCRFFHRLFAILAESTSEADLGIGRSRSLRSNAGRGNHKLVLMVGSSRKFREVERKPPPPPRVYQVRETWDVSIMTDMNSRSLDLSTAIRAQHGIC